MSETALTKPEIEFPEGPAPAEPVSYTHLDVYKRQLMGGTPLGAPIVGAISDSFGARCGLGVAALSGFVAFAIGIGWLLVERRLRVHIGVRGHLTVTHVGRPDSGDDSRAQIETLTAPLSVLRLSRIHI